MDWFPAVVALMVADLYFFAWPHHAKIALSPKFGEGRHFFGKEDLPTIKQPLQETFSLEDEQKPR